MKAELRKLVDGLRDAGEAAKAAADRAAFRAWADVAEALLARAEEKPLSALAGGADAPCCPRCGFSGADDPTPIREGELWAKINALAEAVVARAEEPEQAARERLIASARHLAKCLEQEGNGVGVAAAEDRMIADAKVLARAEGKEPT